MSGLLVGVNGRRLGLRIRYACFAADGLEWSRTKRSVLVRNQVHLAIGDGFSEDLTESLTE